jgi:hypothetical protein
MQISILKKRFPAITSGVTVKTNHLGPYRERAGEDLLASIDNIAFYYNMGRLVRHPERSPEGA